MTDLDRRSGGPSVSVPTLCRALGQLPETEVHLIARRTGDPTVSENEKHFLTHWIDGSRTRVREVLSRILDADPETATVIHCNGLWDPMFHHAAVFARQKNLPLVYSIRGMLEPWALSHKFWKKRIGWWLYQRKDLRCANLLHGSSAAELESIAREGLATLPHLAIPNAISLPPNGEFPRKEAARPTLLFLGRLHPVKGLEELLAAWAEGAPTGWILRLVGPDTTGYRDVLETRIRELGIDKTVRLEPMVGEAEKWRILVEANCLVLPSFSENFGMVVAEALAAGTPAAASTATPWECLAGVGAGWWVQPEKSALRDFLHDLGVKTPEDLAAMGQRGRELAEREFSPAMIAERFRRACANLFAGEGNSGTRSAEEGKA